MDTIFAFVYYSLVAISKVTGLTYEEINIVVYYFIIPFVYFALIDRIIKKHILKIAFTLAVLIFLFFIGDFRYFAQGLFSRSVDFLQGFSKLGWNYVLASVIICVIIPGILFCVLFYYAYKVKIKTLIKRLKHLRSSL